MGLSLLLVFGGLNAIQMGSFSAKAGAVLLPMKSYFRHGKSRRWGSPIQICRRIVNKMPVRTILLFQCIIAAHWKTELNLNLKYDERILDASIIRVLNMSENTSGGMDMTFGTEHFLMMEVGVLRMCSLCFILYKPPNSAFHCIWQLLANVIGRQMRSCSW